MHKTASTSVQTTLYKNRDILNEYGYFYSSVWPAIHGPVFHGLVSSEPEKLKYIIYANRAGDDLELYNKNNLDNIKKEITETDSNKIVFSGEAICFFSIEEVKKLKNLINELVPECQIKVIVSVRNFMDFVTSSFQQKIKQGQSEKSIEKQLIHFQNFYQGKLQKFYNIFGNENITVYKFEDGKKTKFGPVGLFLDVIGVPEECKNRIKYERVNEGISKDAVEIISYINEKEPFYVEDGGISSYRDVYDTRPLYNLYSNEKYYLKDNHYKYLKKYEKRNLNWLKENCSVSYPEYINDKTHSDAGDIDKFSSKLIECLNECNPIVCFLTYQFIKKKGSIYYDVLRRIEDEFKEIDFSKQYQDFKKIYTTIKKD